MDKKIPKFKRQELFRMKKLKDTWRKPRGVDSKMKRRMKGKGSMPSVGYKRTDDVRGLINGLEPVRISTLKELQSLDPKRNIAIIATQLGKRKRAEIIISAEKMGLKTIGRKG